MNLLPIQTERLVTLLDTHSMMAQSQSADYKSYVLYSAWLIRHLSKWSRVSQKYQQQKNLPHILHEAAFIPKKVKPKEIKSFQTFVLQGHTFSFYKGNLKNIQRKICMRTVLALISHIMVQSISNLDQIATFAKMLL